MKTPAFSTRCRLSELPDAARREAAAASETADTGYMMACLSLLVTLTILY